MSRAFSMDAGDGKADVAETDSATISGDIGIVVDHTKFSGTSSERAALETLLKVLVNANTSLT